MFNLILRKMELQEFKDLYAIETIAFGKCEKGDRHVAVDSNNEVLLVDGKKILTTKDFDQAGPAYVYEVELEDDTELIIVSNKAPVTYEVAFTI
jgi:hypothetical protein